MAIFNATFKSKTFNSWVNFNVILPEPCKEDCPWILLLHGLSGNENDWLRFTSAERYALSKGFALVMPNAENSWYTDQCYGKKYYTMISEELINYVRSVFPLSKKREKTFIAGLSMGGYGALKIGLNQPEKFRGIASLSGVVDIYHRFRCDDIDRWGIGFENLATCCWGENYLEVLKDSKENIYSLLRDFDYNSSIKPCIFTACATEDRHYETNKVLHEYLSTLPFEQEWQCCKGEHTWNIWDYYLPQVMDFFAKYMA